MLVYSRIKTECDLIIDRFRSLAAYESDEEWSCTGIAAQERVIKLLEKEPCPEVCCLDVTSETLVAENTRRKSVDTLIVLIVEQTMSPLAYIKPGIMAAGIVLRPASATQMDSVFTEVFDVLKYKQTSEAFKGAVFSLECKDGILKIPCSDILFFEAREKKVFLATKAYERGFYSTLESLEKTLPEGFLRCHKSYIVNLKAISKVSFSENLITLSGGVCVPVSRSYKTSVKEVVK